LASNALWADGGINQSVRAYGHCEDAGEIAAAGQEIGDAVARTNLGEGQRLSGMAEFITGAIGGGAALIVQSGEDVRRWGGDSVDGRDRRVLRKRAGAQSEGFIPVLGILCCLALMSFISLETKLQFGIWLGVGLLFYAGYSYWHSKLRVKKGAGKK
jgi:hypothetical protein